MVEGEGEVDPKFVEYGKYLVGLLERPESVAAAIVVLRGKQLV